ncbi:MAG: 30S ribosomal protein S5 [Planctomycetaceae bacterium]|jgi:small subunit ribosomal protein S5|nr:30S ribosomal protein S5 [Planctomycetaceae bacterium]
MAEFINKDSSSESTTVGVYRTSSTVAGGRRFSFSAMVVVGDRNGRAGVGYAKSNQVPTSIEKAQKEASRKMSGFQLQGKTIPHMVLGRFGATTVKLIPAAPGTGVIAGAAVRAVLDMIGVQDCLTKVYGSSNPKNVVKATMEALSTLRTREQVEALRGVTIPSTSVEEAIKRGAAFMPSSKGGEKMAAPKNTVGEGERRGGRGGRGGPRGPRRDFGAPAPDAGAAPAAPAAPAPEAGA